MKPYAILMFVCVFISKQSMSQSVYVDSLIKKCEIESKEVTANHISTYKKTSCFQPDFQALSFWEFGFIDTIKMKEVLDGSWVYKIQPSRRGVSQVSIKGVRHKKDKGFASFFRVVNKKTGRIIASIDEGATEMFCNNSPDGLRLDQLVVECLNNGTIDKVIWLPQSLSSYVGFKDEKTYIFVFDKVANKYTVVDFKEYFLSHKETLVSDVSGNFKE